jgi:hypothetical protein
VRLFPIEREIRDYPLPGEESGGGGGGGGGGGASAAGWRFNIAEGTETDPTNIVGTVTQDLATGLISVPFTATTISNTVPTAWGMERTIRTTEGVEAEFDLVDLFRSLVRVESLVPPADVHVGLAIYNATGTNGCAWRLASNAGDWRIEVSSLVSSAWSAWTPSTTNSAVAQALLGFAVGGNSGVQGRVGGHVLDAAMAPQTGTTAMAPVQANIGNDMTQVKIFAGFITGTGGSTGTVQFQAGHFLQKMTEIEAFAAFFEPAPVQGAIATAPTTVVVVGQSNSVGVSTDSLWSGKLLSSYPVSVSVNWMGTDITAIPAASGPLGYLIEQMINAGAPFVRVLVQGVNGQNLVAVTGDFGPIVDRLTAKGWTPQHWIYLQGEAETIDPVQSPAATYGARLIHYQQMIFRTYRDCRFNLVTLPMHIDDYGGAGNSVDWPIIEAAQRASVDAWEPGRVLLADSRVPTQLRLVADNVHLYVGRDGGFDLAMRRVRASWGTPPPVQLGPYAAFEIYWDPEDPENDDLWDYGQSLMGTDPVTAAKFIEMAEIPKYLPCASDYGNAHGAPGVNTTLTKAALAGKIAIFWLYSINRRNGASDGNPNTSAAYRTYVDGIAAVIGGRQCIWIIEPDALPLTYALPGGVGGAAATERTGDIAYAVTQLTAAGAECYIDAGDNSFRPVGEIATLLLAANIAGAAGISLNVAHNEFPADEYEYFLQLQEAVGFNFGLVIDVSRCGAGEYDPQPGDRPDVWYINAPGRAMGPPPTFRMNISDWPGLHGVLHLKSLGDSDDDSPKIGDQPEFPLVNAPGPGGFYPSYALSLYDTPPTLDFTPFLAVP